MNGWDCGKARWSAPTHVTCGLWCSGGREGLNSRSRSRDCGKARVGKQGVVSSSGFYIMITRINYNMENGYSRARYGYTYFKEYISDATFLYTPVDGTVELAL